MEITSLKLTDTIRWLKSRAEVFWVDLVLQLCVSPQWRRRQRSQEWVASLSTMDTCLKHAFSHENKGSIIFFLSHIFKEQNRTLRNIYLCIIWKTGHKFTSICNIVEGLHELHRLHECEIIRKTSSRIPQRLKREYLKELYRHQELDPKYIHIK